MDPRIKQVLINGKIEAIWDGRTCKCRHCYATIGFGLTRNMKRLPFDIFKFRQDSPVNEAHWSTCPGADRFRKQKNIKSESRKPLDFAQNNHSR